MDLGFETVGNATLVCHDRGPVIVTDPWIVGNAYFGSWGLSHEIPTETMESIKSCPYVWVSHGHPDHLSSASLALLRDKKCLLPDHVGGRIWDGLKERGFDVTVLKDRRWYSLSDRIRVLCIADYNQDAILMVDVGGSLVVNFNDASDYGWGGFVKRIIRKYRVSFHLQLSVCGDADMINIWRDDGTFIEPRSVRQRAAGKLIARETARWSESSELLPAFIRYDVVKAGIRSARAARALSRTDRSEGVWRRLVRTACVCRQAKDHSVFQSHFAPTGIPRLRQCTLGR